ncbi:MAG: hypothetical protein K9N34_03685 [Candidatus Marinimicrobia bacterium]|nr:hypothetical protein [Candidatus Neomarinimicrobiota bacterium]
MAKKKNKQPTDSVKMMTPRGDEVLVPLKKVAVKKSWGWVIVEVGSTSSPQDEKPANKGRK